jgi:hypothetical protein
LWLSRPGAETFTVVKVTSHAAMGAGDLSKRASAGVSTVGRTARSDGAQMSSASTPTTPP